MEVWGKVTLLKTEPLKGWVPNKDFSEAFEGLSCCSGTGLSWVLSLCRDLEVLGSWRRV